MRNVQKLQSAAPDSRLLDFVAANAKSVWASDRNAMGELGVDWAGPWVGPASAALQSSGLDALVAAAAFEGKGIAS